MVEYNSDDQQEIEEKINLLSKESKNLTMKYSISQTKMVRFKKRHEFLPRVFRVEVRLKDMNRLGHSTRLKY